MAATIPSERLVGRFLDRISALATEAVRRQRKVILSAYQPELVSTIRRVSEIKNLLYRQRPARLKDIFVAPMLEIEDKPTDSNDVLKEFLSGRRIVIRGSAGLGKSVLLKYFCLQHLDMNLECAPLFIELRKLNGPDTADLLTALHHTYRGSNAELEKDELAEALRTGTFSVLLDGFDEVGPDHQQQVEASILRFAHEFPRCPLIVSGRDDKAFFSWEQFHVYKLLPMTRSSTVELIEKLDYDGDLKAKFISSAVPKLFSNADRSFVQTPLLAILMLLTYELYAEVPDKMHLFYAHAFETLLRGHDVTKAQFRRPLRSGVSEEDFKRVFAAFCALTYSKRKFEFNADEIETSLSQALGATCITAPVRALIDDLVLSVCVMQIEGLEYSFVHRSFQEYFTAVYLREAPLAVVEKFMDSSAHTGRENVVPMLYGMDRDRIEKEWCLPRLEELAAIIKARTKAARIRLFFNKIYERYRFGYADGSCLSLSALGNQRMSRVISLLGIMYPNTNGTYWWFKSWAGANAIAAKIALLISEGKLPRSHYTVTDRDGNTVLKGSEDLADVSISLTLAGLDDALLKDTGLWDVGSYFVDILDATRHAVNQRVANREELEQDLFEDGP